METGRVTTQPDPCLELERQFRTEYGAPREVVVRFAGMLAGSGLLYGYTGWISAWAWALSFLGAQAAYFLFLRSRMTRAMPRDVTLAGLLFLVLLVAFLWMPALMICENDRALSISGAALVGCILVFLVRRSDSAPLMVYGEVVVIASVIGLVFLRLIPQFSDIYAQLGLLVSGLALQFYFIEAAASARRLRTEAAEANARSLQAEKMAAIGRLAGGVAHDFNNNLTAILGHLELLALETDPEERRASLHEASVAGAQAARTVKQLLAFARKDRLAMAPQDGAEVLEGLVALTRRLIPTSVAITVDPGGPAQGFQADRAQLLSALINLVVNAVDAMPSGGQLTLSSGVVGLTKPLDLADGSRLPAGAYVRIAVQDSGTGIPPHILPKVLEPFFTTKPVGKGTGLGLPMAFGVSREFGGGLTIASAATGTTVAIYLPKT
jgi:two-component system cell cycle sensor histidine kinase/response regulator CckA